MRNKLLVGIIIVVMIIVGVIVAFMNITNNAQRVETTGDQARIPVEACDILTKTVVQEVLGDDIAQQKPAAGATGNSELSITTCAYSTSLNASKPANATLLARVALTPAGSDTNKQQFKNSRPDDAKDVQDIGDAAYFSPTFRQLNVLVGGNWYILTSYTGDITKSTLESLSKLAEKLNFE